MEMPMKNPACAEHDAGLKADAEGLSAPASGGIHITVAGAGTSQQ
jgi:hypothetical protein